MGHRVAVEDVERLAQVARGQHPQHAGGRRCHPAILPDAAPLSPFLPILALLPDPRPGREATARWATAGCGSSRWTAQHREHAATVPAIHRPLATAERIRREIGTEPVTVADVLALGVTPGQLRAAVSSGALVRLRRGIVGVPTADVVALTDPDRDGWARRRADHVRAARSALMALGDGSVVSHASAAVLRELPLPLVSDWPTPVWVTAPRHGRVVAGTHRRLGTALPPDVGEVEGVRCTSLARTALDLARRRPLQQALVALDAAARRDGLDPLWSAYERLTWQRDRRALRDALAVTDGRSESPLESTSRGVMLRAGLPRPELQVWLVDRAGRSHRVDFLWRERRVVGEADGWGKYAEPADLRAEKRREDALRELGFTVVRWTSDEIGRAPNLVVARLRRALE